VVRHIFALYEVVGTYSCLVTYEIFINFISITSVCYQVRWEDVIIHIKLYQPHIALLHQNMCTFHLALSCIIAPGRVNAGWPRIASSTNTTIHTLEYGYQLSVSHTGSLCLGLHVLVFWSWNMIYLHLPHLCLIYSLSARSSGWCRNHCRLPLVLVEQKQSLWVKQFLLIFCIVECFIAVKNVSWYNTFHSRSNQYIPLS
jgi:hypothetical protein